MGLFDALDVSASGLTAERLRMDTIANNLANANSVKGADGKPFQRQVVELGARGAQGGGTGGASFASFGGFQQAAAGGGVQALSIGSDTTPGKKVYDPGNPDADRKGYVTMSNVNPVTEMVDLITATRGYEADTTAIKAVEGMAQHAMDVIR
jgi:flagellar basal-body rod protein FlgC